MVFLLLKLRWFKHYWGFIIIDIHLFDLNLFSVGRAAEVELLEESLRFGDIILSKFFRKMAPVLKFFPSFKEVIVYQQVICGLIAHS